MEPLLIPSSPGELIDKLTILKIKSEKILDAAKLANVRHELDVLGAVAARALPDLPELTQLWQDLHEINLQLWAIEDDIRACEARADFGPSFIELARSVYLTNDKRAEIKKVINVLLRSDMVEEKSYARPDPSAR